MDIGRRMTLVLAAVLAPMLLTACGGGAVPGVGSAQNGLGGSVGTSNAAFALPYSVPKVAGTYDGSYSETIGVQTVKGTVEIVVNQNGKAISGMFDPTINGFEFDTTFSGTVRSVPTGTKLKFTIINLGGTRNGAATATVSGSRLKGRAIVPATQTQKEIIIKFNTTKQ